MGRNTITVLGIFLIIAVFIYVFFIRFNGDQAITETTEYGIDTVQQIDALNAELEDYR